MSEEFCQKCQGTGERYVWHNDGLKSGLKKVCCDCDKGIEIYKKRRSSHEV